MKKLLLLLGTAGILATNVFAHDFKVGDRMPNFDKGYGTYWVGGWKEKGKEGTYIKWDKRDVRVGLDPNIFLTGDGKPDYIEVRIRCDGKIIRTPFGVGDYKKGLAYLDLDGDGLINEIVSNKGRNIADDAPECPKN